MDYLKDFRDLKRAETEEQGLRSQQDALIIDLHKIAKICGSKELDKIAICLSGLHNFAKEWYSRRSVIYNKYFNFTQKTISYDWEIATPDEDENSYKIFPKHDKLPKAKVEENKEDANNLNPLNEDITNKEIIDLTEDKISENNIVNNYDSKHDSDMKMIKYSYDIQSPKQVVKEFDTFEEEVEEHSKSSKWTCYRCEYWEGKINRKDCVSLSDWNHKFHREWVLSKFKIKVRTFKALEQCIKRGCGKNIPSKKLYTALSDEFHPIIYFWKYLRGFCGKKIAFWCSNCKNMEMNDKWESLLCEWGSTIYPVNKLINDFWASGGSDGKHIVIKLFRC